MHIFSVRILQNFGKIRKIPDCPATPFCRGRAAVVAFAGRGERALLPPLRRRRPRRARARAARRPPRRPARRRHWHTTACAAARPLPARPARPRERVASAAASAAAGWDWCGCLCTGRGRTYHVLRVLCAASCGTGTLLRAMRAPSS